MAKDVDLSDLVDSPAPARTEGQFSSLMDKTFGKGKWRETSGFRSPEKEDELRSEGAGTVPAGHTSKHSEGSAEAPGARDVVVDGLTPEQVADRLSKTGAKFRHFFPEGARGKEGAHLHIDTDLSPDPVDLADLVAPAKPTKPGIPAGAPKAGPAPDALHRTIQNVIGETAPAREKLSRDMQGSPLLDRMPYGNVVQGVEEVGDLFTILGKGVEASVGRAMYPGDTPGEDPKQAAGRRALLGDIAQTLVPIGGVGEVKAGVKVAEKAISKGAEVITPAVKWLGKLRGEKVPLTDAEIKILHRMSQGEGPTAQDMLALAKKTPDKPVTIMDLGGPNVQGLAGTVARRPGPGKAKVTNFLEGRAKATPSRMEGDIERNVHPASADETIEVMKKARQAAATPKYQEAYAANPTVASPVVDEILRSTEVAPMWKKALAKMQADYAGTNTPRPDKYSLEALDYVKKEMDNDISAAIRAGRNNDARFLGGLKNRFVSELDQADKTGAYKAARDIWAGDTHSMEAVEFGERALAKNSSARSNAKAIAAMAPGDKEFARIGLAKRLKQMMLDHKLNHSAAHEFARSPYIQDKARPLFDSQEAYDKFIDAVSAEDTMAKTHGEVLKGSQTASRVMEDQTDAGLSAAAHGAATMAHAGHGNALGVAIHGKQFLKDLATIRDPKIGSDIADILTSPLNDQEGAGMRFLRKHAAVAPRTRNYLRQAAGRVDRSEAPPLNQAQGR